MFFGAMLAVYLYFRHQAGGQTVGWLPKGAHLPAVPANTMLVTMIAASVMAQWAVYATAHGDRRGGGLALTLTALFGVLVVNAQMALYQQYKQPLVPKETSPYNTIFFTITGTLVAAVLSGVVFAAVIAFRSFGGRYSVRDHEGVSAMALYWHFLTAALAAVWFVVYVTK
jgi:cytochrome c oxidase subunit III